MTAQDWADIENEGLRSLGPASPPDMARVLKRVAAKRDLTDHFVFFGETASVDVARRFLHAANVSFQALAKMPELGRATELSECALV
jgi:toxin ParE1/3/4